MIPLPLIPLSLAWLCRKHIDAGPHLGGCPPLQVIVGSFVVVPGPNLLQLPRQRSLVCNGFGGQFPLDRPDEPLDPSILPGTARLDPLLTNPQHQQAQPKPSRDQHRFIVCPQELWPTIVLYGLHEFL